MKPIRKCSYCDKKYFTNGLCQTHYSRQRYSGSIFLKTKPKNFYKSKRESKRAWTEENKDHIRQYQKKYRKENPWIYLHADIGSRCNNPKVKGFKNYGRRGIKRIITVDQIKELWFRDKAFDMKRPSIDRIDNDGNYEINNCRFVELSENCKRRNLNWGRSAK